MCLQDAIDLAREVYSREGKRRRSGEGWERIQPEQHSPGQWHLRLWLTPIVSTTARTAGEAHEAMGRLFEAFTPAEVVGV